MKLPEMTIHDIQRALASGELSAKEIARHTLENIARVNPQINAWTHISEKRMLAEAENIDTLRREKKPLPALAGVPYAVKIFSMSPDTRPMPGRSCWAIAPPPLPIAGRCASCTARARCSPGC